MRIDVIFKGNRMIRLPKGYALLTNSAGGGFKMQHTSEELSHFLHERNIGKQEKSI